MQDQIHFEAAFRPHQKKLQNEIDEHLKRIDDTEKALKEFNEKINVEVERMQDRGFQSPLDYASDIDKLEKKMMRLLKQKSEYLEKIKESGVDVQNLV